MCRRFQKHLLIVSTSSLSILPRVPPIALYVALMLEHSYVRKRGEEKGKANAQEPNRKLSERMSEKI